KKSVCAMYQDTDFGKEVMDGVQMQVDKMKIKLAETTTHKPTDQDFTAQITKLKSAGCDLVVMGTIVRDSIVPYATARKIGWTDVDFLGSAASYDLVVAAAQRGVTGGRFPLGLPRQALSGHPEPHRPGLVRPLQGPLQDRAEHRRRLRPRGRRSHRGRLREGGQGPHPRQLYQGHGIDQGLQGHLQRARGELRPRQAPGRQLLLPRRGQGGALSARHRSPLLLIGAALTRAGRGVCPGRPVRVFTRPRSTSAWPPAG